MDEQVWDTKSNSFVSQSKPSKKKGFWSFSKQEKIDLLVSWITLSIAFSLVLMSFDLTSALSGVIGYLPPLLAVPIAFVAVGTGFIFHELAHRQAARHFGFVSEYRAWYPMLLLAVIFAFLTGWILAAPGATYFFGRNVSRKQNGIISVAGPVINTIIGILLLLISLAFASELIKIVLVSAARINFFFALFNLLPIWILDGEKVLAWNPIAWFLAILIPAISILFPGLLFGFFI
jgi:Zn-dependent protease